MGWIERAVRAASRMRDDRAERLGLGTALGAGVAVSMPVARTFLGFGPGWESAGLATVLAGIAFACTTAGTLLALRAKTTGKAVLWVALSNIVPPTIVCAPTIYGLIISVPSGVAAALAVLPFALAARRTLRSERAGHAERDRLIGAAIAGLSAVGLAAYELTDAAPYVVRPLYDLVPATLAALVALALGAWTAAVEARRTWVGARLARGDVRGYRLGPEAAGAALVERVEEPGAGPLRAAPTREVVGALPAPSPASPPASSPAPPRPRCSSP
ncbi:MAG: hypothetical protein M5U28_24895 [Sandaracinaceae bacterium]|nr:hypothetical protein [Sandaracinaceae bacterium]